MSSCGQLLLEPGDEYIESSPSVQQVRSDLRYLHKIVRQSAVYVQVIPKPPPKHAKYDYITDYQTVKILKHRFWRSGSKAGHIKAADISTMDGDIRIILSQDFLRSRLTFKDLQINQESLHHSFNVAVWARLFASDCADNSDQGSSQESLDEQKELFKLDSETLDQFRA
jgi:hypothetical protein